VGNYHHPHQPNPTQSAVSLPPAPQTTHTHINHVCRVLRLISPMDVDAVLDYYIAQGLDRDPYWCRAWPSAICLAQQLLQRPDLVEGRWAGKAGLRAPATDTATTAVAQSQ
jgi:predicted nicotinamide N-methyase